MPVPPVDVRPHSGSKVIFGPASRPLPQLPIAVDAEGYLVAQSDFNEPVGPSYWERESMSAAQQRSPGLRSEDQARTHHGLRRRARRGFGILRESAARSSRTTGRSCSARWRCTRFVILL